MAGAKPAKGSEGMVRTPSTMLPLGTPAPTFELPDVCADNRLVRLADFAGKPALVVMFICNHCPYVKHIRAGVATFAREYIGRGVGVVAVNSNDAANYPDDAPDKMKAEAEAAGYVFPYLFDESQTVAKAYRAACTPDFFVFDAAGTLAYRGQFDDSRPGQENEKIPVTGRDLRQALDAILTGQPVTTEQKPSLGCNIKWKPGNAPDYFNS